MSFYVGAHLSKAFGYRSMLDDAQYLNATAIAFFPKSPRGGRMKALTEDDKVVLRYMCAMYAVVVHAPYVMNLCSYNEYVAKSAEESLKEDLEFMYNLPGAYYNFHPGNAGPNPIRQGLDEIADALNRNLKEDMPYTVVLETMAGKGSELGKTFSELSYIIDNVELKDKIGVCLDTCHIWDAGYDFRNIDILLEEFDSCIGLEYLKAVHFNDSKNPKGSHKDRHTNIGAGEIGIQNMHNFICHKAIRRLPIILETPGGDEYWKAEINAINEWLRED